MIIPYISALFERVRYSPTPGVTGRPNGRKYSRIARSACRSASSVCRIADGDENVVGKEAEYCGFGWNPLRSFEANVCCATCRIGYESDRSLDISEIVSSVVDAVVV